jgi:hypothetical protein
VWPWEHLALGYLLVSLTIRVVAGRPPRDHEAIVVAVATQCPDLVDKPMAWTFDVLPSGLSLAHSLTVAVPLTTLAFLLSHRRGTPGLGIAVAVGYGSHLFADALYPVVYGDPVRVAFLLWPVLEGPQDPAMLGGLGHVFTALARLELLVSTPAGPLFLVVEFALLGGAVGVWLQDGSPGVIVVRRSIDRTR